MLNAETVMYLSIREDLAGRLSIKDVKAGIFSSVSETVNALRLRRAGL